jgi:hypothetical protein
MTPEQIEKLQKADRIKLTTNAPPKSVLGRPANGIAQGVAGAALAGKVLDEAIQIKGGRCARSVEVFWQNHDH